MLINFVKNKNRNLFLNLINSEPKTFKIHSKLLFDFFDQEKLIKSIIMELKNTEMYLVYWKDIYESILSGEEIYLDNEKDLAACSL